MWWKCDGDKYVNMKHMATLRVEGIGDENWAVYAYEIAEQSKYMIKDFPKKEDAEKLMKDIANAVK